MTASERREAIKNTLLVRRKDSAFNLAQEFGVSERTIRNDITILTSSCPLVTKRGRYGGGIEVEEGYLSDRKFLTQEQVDLLERLAPRLDEDDLKVLNSIILQFALNKQIIRPDERREKNDK